MALNGLDISVTRGEIRGLIGPNGAGKTTLINVINGIYQPDRGKIEFLGKDITGDQPHQIAVHGIGRTFQTAEPFAELTVLENIMIARHIHSKSGLFASALRLRRERAEDAEVKEKALQMVELVGISALKDRTARSLAFAQLRLMEIARALALDPQLLLLDEPACGMNQKEVDDLLGLLKRVRDEFGKTILLIEHNLNFVMGISDRITVLDNGEKIAEGRSDEVRNNPKVIEAYIGRGEEGKN